jgi:cob(I)alamin adenosyltransferase
MSIATRTGDSGTTALMYNRRVSKTHPRVQACGSIDELNAALGMARAFAEAPFVRDNLILIQNDLIVLMGELATDNQDLARYAKDGFTLVSAEMAVKLDKLVQEIEAQKVSFRGWATPGANAIAAALDVARTTCRRAERAVCVLREGGQSDNPHILVYLNRLSDMLWLMARWSEVEAGK